MARQPKLLFHVEMIVDANALHAITSVAGESAFNVQIKPVRADEVAPAENGRAASGSVRQALVPWLAQQRSRFTSGEALTFGEQNNIPSGSIHSALASFTKGGLLKRIEPGVFKTTAKGKRAAQDMQAERATTEPAQTVPAPGTGNGHAPPAPADKRKTHELKHTDFTLKQIAAGVVTYKAIKQAFADDGRNPTSIDGSLGHLRKDKMITGGGGGDGAYKLLVKGEAHLKAL